MESIIAHPKNNEQLAVVKAIMKALKISFEIEKSPYDQEFVAIVKKADKEILAGKYTKIKPSDIWKLT